uniref:SFRICE_031008 n=1 Tax=Spodoptera frugiperda TaxID=7108 RepID=A0A2H1VXT6_SPOFR
MTLLQSPIIYFTFIFYIITPLIPEGVGRGAHYDTYLMTRQCTLTFHNLCCKSHVIEGRESIVIYSTILDSVLQLRNVRKAEKSPVIHSLTWESNPRPLAPAVAHATTRPMRQGRGFDHFDPRLLSIKLGVELSLNGLEVSPLSHCIVLLDCTLYTLPDLGIEPETPNQSHLQPLDQRSSLDYDCLR